MAKRKIDESVVNFATVAGDPACVAEVLQKPDVLDRPHLGHMVHIEMCASEMHSSCSCFFFS